MAKETYVKIPLAEFQELLEKEKDLDALECGGVDNWEWYSESFKEAAYNAGTVNGVAFRNYEEYIKYFTSKEYIKVNYEIIEEEM